MRALAAILLLCVQGVDPCSTPCDQGQCSEFGGGFWTDWCNYQHPAVTPLACPPGWQTNAPCLLEAQWAYIFCVANAVADACAEQLGAEDRWCARQQTICGRFESCWDSCILSPQPQLCQQGCLALRDAALAANCVQVGEDFLALEISAGFALGQCDAQFQAAAFACCMPPFLKADQVARRAALHVLAARREPFQPQPFTQLGG